MPIIPTWLLKDGHIPLPWAVHYHFLHLLILKDWQSYFYLDTSSGVHWSVTIAGCSHHCQVHRALITPSIRTPIPWRGLASRRTSKNPWCSLSPVSSTTSNDALSTRVSSPSHLPSDAPSSRPCIQSSTLHAPAKDQTALPSLRGTLVPWPSSSFPQLHPQ